MEPLKGTVERITFHNDENGYSVVKIKADKRYPTAEARDGMITVVGTMPEIGVGESIQFDGDWVEDPRYGKQFRAEMTTPIMPTTESGIVNYLSSGIVKGIGPKTAQKIVDYFGTATIDVLDNAPRAPARSAGTQARTGEKPDNRLGGESGDAPDDDLPARLRRHQQDGAAHLPALRLQHHRHRQRQPLRARRRSRRHRLHPRRRHRAEHGHRRRFLQPHPRGRALHPEPVGEGRARLLAARRAGR